MCREAIMKDAVFPSSVDIHTLTGTSVFEAANGNTEVRMDFDAKNALGNELPFSARCLVLPNSKLDAFSIKRR
jgi:hypothetical protein